MQVGIHNIQFKFSEKKSVQDKLLIFTTELVAEPETEARCCRSFGVVISWEQSMIGLETAFSN
jgi:hypothetical protein